MNYSPKVLDSANSKIYGKLQEQALKMRDNPTKAEAKMWEVLRRKNLGVKFRQQHVMNQFIVDFYCVEKSLIIDCS